MPDEGQTRILIYNQYVEHIPVPNFFLKFLEILFFQDPCQCSEKCCSTEEFANFDKISGFPIIFFLG
jgi:hypothetical protein